MLQRFREYLALLLIILLPFHALAVTVLTKVITGPGHAPLATLAIWKEGLLALILLIAFIEILTGGKKWWKIDLIDGLIFALIAVGLVVSLLLTPNLSLLLLGFKYDFVPLIAFVILRRVTWSEWFKETVTTAILRVGGIVAAYGILTLFLPDSFFYWLGYSDLHSLYVPGKPLAAFQQIGGSALHRIQSAMSGPNQLGVWLLIPLGVILMRKKSFLVFWFSGFLVCAALLLTFSRAAWIAAFVMVIVAAWPMVNKRASRGVVIACVISFLIIVAGAVAIFPSVLLRVSSSRGHVENPIAAVQKMIAHPLGLGLGSAGPASNRVSDACVMLESGDDPSWAKDRPDLCVFVGETKVQPMNRDCNCPFLPENWYLQIGVELGVAGFALYIILVCMLLFRLRSSKFSFSIFNSPFSIFLGVSIAALFLHAWEDAAVAYTVWMLLSCSLFSMKHARGRS